MYQISLIVPSKNAGLNACSNRIPVSKSKKEVIAYLQKNYEDLQKTITGGTINEDFIKGFQATIDHITHHRGQAIVYLRCNGIPAPEYCF